MPTDQISEWTGDFGRDYTDRNPRTVDELDALYRAQFGVTRRALNAEFLGDLPRDASILEVGANVGVQLLALSEMGFGRLHGIEIQRYAVAKARRALPQSRLVQASAFALPFGAGAFDMTYTSGVLIHLAPTDLVQALDEIHRTSRRYIWGWEYDAEMHVEIPYRGRGALMWKGPFARMYLERFPDLTLVRERAVPYLEGGNRDRMYLLEKRP